GLDKAIELAKVCDMPLKIAAKIDRVDVEYFNTVIKPLLNHPLVEFIGEIGYPEKCDFLGNAAALLFPIQWPEPFGLVMIEAMACGTPVIAYPCGSVPEVIEDGVNGFIVTDISEAVNAVSNIEQIERTKCRRRFEQRFTAVRMAEEYLALYSRLVKGQTAPLTVSDGVLSWMKLESSSSTT